MISLTTPIAVPNLTRLRVMRVNFFDDNSVAIVRVEALSPAGGARSKQFDVTVTNGGTGNPSTGLRANPTPLSWDDLVTTKSIEVSGAYDRLESAYRGAANKAAAYRAVETSLITDAIIDSTLAGTVS